MEVIEGKELKVVNVIPTYKKAEVEHFFKFITPRREKHILKFTIRALRIGISIVFLIFY